MATKEPILSARDVEIQFSLRGRKLTAIRKCSLDLYEGETLAIVGESGSGKSVFTKSFIGMLDANGSIIGGSIMYDGVDISKYKTEKEWMTIRGKKIAMVMQDPMTSLNPLKVVGKQIQESIELHQGLKGEEAKKEAIEMLRKVGIPNPERRYNQYPHEFSGGQRQRIGIARALAIEPEFIVCDEPISALDVSIQAQVVNLLIKLQKELGLTYLFIAHDLSMVKHISDRVGVMYLGSMVEFADSDELYSKPLHPYTKALMSAIPIPDPKAEKEKKRIPIEGEIPSPINPKPGCRFAARCKYATEACKQTTPELTEVLPGHFVACHRVKEVNALGL